MPPETQPAVSGVVYTGTFIVQVYDDGMLGEWRITGEGWQILEADYPAEARVSKGDVLRVRFRALPGDADQPIGLSLTFDGRRAAQRYAVGLQTFARFAQVQPAIQLSDNKSDRVGGDVRGGEECPCAGFPIDLVKATGRIVYTRPDGKVVGADRLRVQLRDQDVGVDFEVMWEGFTDANGYFDTGCRDAELDGDGSGPDLVLYFETDNGWVDVSDNSILESTYSWSTSELSNFAFSCHDYGTLTPADAGTRAALHISNVITRARRYLDQVGGFAPDAVQVEWPVEEWTHYQRGPEEIHLNPLHEWEEFVIVHEYGHHFMNHFGEPPSPVYCNGFCDNAPPEDCGHCAWCPENPQDAFNEGFPNWMADVATRAFAETYELSPGVPYEPILDVTVEAESPLMCSADFNGQPVDPFLGDPVDTEGFVGLLLRDMEDGTQDDHDFDGVYDMLCTGAAPILDTYVQDQATTVLQFINHFRSRYPGTAGNFWPTAFNVGGSTYVAGFPSDSQPPGVVGQMDSSTHPSGTGGELPCITFEFDAAPDDMTGAGTYSYALSSSPAGTPPDELPELTWPTGGCRLQGAVQAWNIGTWYISIRARDNDDNWSGNYATFGPFEVLDCNGTGQLDVCDISCSFTGSVGQCSFGISPCVALPQCTATSADCNSNLRPDECDIASGVSADCNLDGIPDECQDMKHWSGSGGANWALATNWVENEIPQTGEHVCITSVSPVQVLYQIQSGVTSLASLAAHEGLTISSATNPWPAMVLSDPSFVLGEFILGGSSTSLTVNDTLDLYGLFRWNGGILKGAGVTEARGGLALTTSGVNLQAHDFRISANPATSLGGQIALSGGALLVIEPDVTYEYRGGSGNVFSGGAADLIHNAGTILRTAGTGTANLNGPVTNVGTIHAQTGLLSLGQSSTHSGLLLGDSSTVVSFGGAGPHAMLAPSILDVETLEFFSGQGDFRGTVNIGDTLDARFGTYTFHPEAEILSYGQHLSATIGNTGASATVHFLAPTDAPIEFETVTVGPTGSEGNPAIHFNTGQPVEIGDLLIRRGHIHGNSSINIHGTFTWNTHGFGSAGADVTAFGPVTLQVPSSGSKALQRILHNTQTTTMLGGGLNMTASGRWNNLPGSMFQIQANTASVSGGTFTNAGTILRASGTGVVTLGSNLVSTGNIHNQTGTMRLSAGGTYSGEVRSDPGTILEISQVPTHNFGLTSALIAESLMISVGGQNTSAPFRGTVEISDSITCSECNWIFAVDADVLDYGDAVIISPGGSLRFDAPTDRPIDFDSVTIGPSTSGGSTFNANTGQPFNIDTLVMDNNAQLSGTSPINVASQFTWRNGNMFAGGAVTLAGSSNVLPTSSNRSSSRVMHNHGYFAMLGAFSLAGSASFNNHPDGVVDFQSDGAGISSRPINNAGLIVKSGGTGQANVNFSTWTNTGTVEIQSGSIGMHTTQFVQNSGQTILNGGDLRIIFGTFPVTLNGGVLMGVNTVFGNLVNNAGTIAPGLSVGELTVSGNCTQGASARLEVEIAGTSPEDSDQLTVTGTAALAGTLRVTFVNGFVVEAGDVFQIVSAGNVSGEFDSVEFTNPPASLTMTVIYAADAVVIEAIGATPGDCDDDGDVDLDDFADFDECLGGPGGELLAGCECFDLDDSGDVTLLDFAVFQVAL